MTWERVEPKPGTIDITGSKEFGDWEVLYKVFHYPSIWMCKCKCGKVKHVYYCNLRSGMSSSCQKCGNDRRKGVANFKHGLSGTTGFVYWIANRHRFPKAWRNDIRAWISDVGEKPHGLGLVKIDNRKPLSKNNLRWVKRSGGKKQILIKIDGVDMALLEIAGELGISRQAVHQFWQQRGPAYLRDRVLAQRNAK